MRSVVPLLVLAGCGLGPDRLTVSGRAVVAPSAAARAAAVPLERTVTHVMAVDPESASPRRSLAAVGSDGSFTLEVDVGSPYVLVFVDDTAVGAAMAVAVFRAGTLDTLSPQLAGQLDLGDTMVDPTTQTATAAVPYGELIGALGLSPEAAEYLGVIDDLSLRYANPDIDGNGVVDVVEDHRFALDVHVRSNLRRGSSAGPSFTVSDIMDRFVPESGPDVAVPVYNLTSAYVLYPSSYDATEYVAMGPPATQLQNGAAFVATHADGSEPGASTSFSQLGFGDTRGWGPDYDLERSTGLELPGSSGSPATLAYTLGATGTTLTFTNVVTRSRASLTAEGSLAIFVRLRSDAGAFAAIDYRWMKLASAASWVPATADEIALTISGGGGHITFHRVPSWHDELGVTIPAEPSGTIAWDFAPAGPADICGMAVSYDDKLGMRHFVGGVEPDPGVTCTF